MMKKSAVWLLAFLTVFPALTRADDESSGVALPGMRSWPTGSATGLAASVRLDKQAITVDLSIATNETPDPELRWESPVFGWVGASDPYPDRQFSDLTFALDDEPVHPRERVDAFSGERHIESLLDAARLDPLAIVETPPFVKPDADAMPAWHALEALGAVQRVDGGYVANWKVKRTLAVSLMPLATQRVRWSYAARPAYGLIRADQIATPLRQARYCLSAQQIGQLVGRHPKRFMSVFEYDIPIGLDDKAPQSIMLRVLAVNHVGHHQGRIFVCAADQRAVVARDRLAATVVAADLRGVLHVMKIDDVAAP